MNNDAKFTLFFAWFLLVVYFVFYGV